MLVPLVPVLYLAFVTPLLVIFDLRSHRLPNRLVLPGIAMGAASVGVQWWLDARLPIVPLLAAVGYAAFLFALNLVGGMGMGDVKLSALLGLASWNSSVAILSPVLAFLAGGVASVALLLSGRRGRMAFGPFLLAGFWCAAAIAVFLQP